MTTELTPEDVIVQLSSPPERAGVGGGAELGRRLLLAARAGDTDAVLDLMAKGAPFTTDWLGTSPLHLAAANNHVETCAVLLRAGVSRDARTKVERTPLHLAACAGHAAAVGALLQHGAAVDCRDMLLMTPLHWAAARGHGAVARCLLAHGADPRARCKFRKTPRCLALRAARADVLAALDDHAAAEGQLLDKQLKAQPLFQKADIKLQTKPKVHTEKKIIIESKTQPIPAGAAGGAAGGGAGAALLRAHGITLLPADRGSTVLSALRSGRTVVLSDAGKLMLKESRAGANEPQILTSNANTGVGVAAAPPAHPGVAGDGAGAAGRSAQGFGKGARLKPAKLGKGVKLVTLNKNQPLKRIIHPNDLQQVRVVCVPAGAGAGAEAGAAAGKARPALKLVLDKAHLSRLLRTSRVASQARVAGTERERGMEGEPEREVGADVEGEAAASEGEALRAQLHAAHARLASLGAELRACRARLARYEP